MAGLEPMSSKRRDWLGYLSDVLMLLASLLWLFDWTPLDRLRSPNLNLARSAAALLGADRMLIRSTNAVGPDPRADTSDEKYAALVEIIRGRWSRASTVDWSEFVGFQTYTFMLPIDGEKIPGAEAICLLKVPPRPGELQRVPVALASEINSWITARHSRNVTVTVAFLLLLGFGLQVVNRARASQRTTRKNSSHEG